MSYYLQIVICSGTDKLLYKFLSFKHKYLKVKIQIKYVQL